MSPSDDLVDIMKTCSPYDTDEVIKTLNAGAREIEYLRARCHCEWKTDRVVKLCEAHLDFMRSARWRFVPIGDPSQ